MRKYIAFLLVAILLLSSLAGCANNENNNDEYNNEEQNKEYRTYVVDYSDSLGIKGLRVEYEIQDYEGFKDKKGPKNVTFKLHGKETTIDLSGTEGKFYRNNYYPVYEYGDAWFNPKGIMEKCSFYDIDKPFETSCSEEEAIQVAKDFMKDTVNININEFITTSVSKNENHRLYFVYFCKTVDETMTTEEVEVSVTFDGKIEGYVADMLGQFTNDTKNPFDMEKVEKIVDARIEEYTKDIKDQYDRIECDKEFRLTRLKDGSLAILCKADILCLRDVGDETEVGGELIEMLVMQ